MSWLQQLYKTYEWVSEQPQLTEDGKPMPYYHVMQNAHINIVLDGEGNFRRASLFKSDKNSDKVKPQALMIPATNDSATRSGQNPPPHPLSDKLQYVASTLFECYADNPKRDFYPDYHKQLADWCASEFSHPKAQAVLNYVEKGQIIEDLAGVGIVFLDDGGKLLYPSGTKDYPNSIFAGLTKSKGVFDQSSAVVAWSVEIKGDNFPNTWEDESLVKAWQDYYASQGGLEGLCYVSGEQTLIASKHPNRILKSATNAKLISANDMDGFTFLGKFTDTKKSRESEGLQGANVGALVTEKAHATLAWLLARQGHEEAGQATVAWAVDKEIPQPLEDVGNYLDDDDLSLISAEEADKDEPTKKQLSNDLGRQMSEKLRLKLKGYKRTLSDTDQLSIITLDAATPGRMAVTYYYETVPSRYIDNLERWFEQFAWYQRHSKDMNTGKKKAEKIVFFPVKPPSPYQIAQTAYGSRLSDELKRQTYARLLPCIAEGAHRNVPYYLVELCFQRACSPLATEHWEWERNVGVACALYRGFYARHPKPEERRNFNVALDTTYHSRDYLYGRLLAVAENIESLALYVAGEQRATTAERYMQRFAEQPFSTWRNIELALKNYKDRLRNSRAGFLHNREKEMQAIMASFAIEDFNNDNKLSGEFLLGYHCQKMVYRLEQEQKAQDKQSKQDK